MELQRQTIHPGKTVLESRRGSTGDEINPWFAIERGNPQDEDSGNVWFGALGWSGSWQIRSSRMRSIKVRITGGFDPFDFSYRPCIWRIVADADVLRWLLSTWHWRRISSVASLRTDDNRSASAATSGETCTLQLVEAIGFDLDESGQEVLAQKAASIGVERFVMDDGWFGQRKNDQAGLGDWYVNPVKFPQV